MNEVRQFLIEAILKTQSEIIELLKKQSPSLDKDIRKLWFKLGQQIDLYNSNLFKE